RSAMSRSSSNWWRKALTRTLFRGGPTAPIRQRPRSCRLRLEALEDRVTPNAYLVNVLGDESGLAAGTASGDGNAFHGDLRYCLNKAILDQQTDTITFAASLLGQTITPSSSLVTAPSGFTNPFGQTAFIVGASDNITIDGSGGAPMTISSNFAT